MQNTRPAEGKMGFIYTDITLVNSTDAVNAHNGIIAMDAVRQATVKALVDTGATTLVISEDLCKQLGLAKWYSNKSKVAGGGQIDNFYTYPVLIKWKNRGTAEKALVVKEQDPPLLGALALEGLDLLPDPLNETVVGRHGDEPVSYIM